MNLVIKIAVLSEAKRRLEEIRNHGRKICKGGAGYVDELFAYWGSIQEVASHKDLRRYQF